MALPEQTNLRERFASFLKTIRGFEDIDALLMGVGPEGKKRADYLVWNRQVIVEQKALVVDPADKPQKFVDQLMKEGRLVAYGRTSTRAIFDKVPNDKELERRMLLGITKGLESSVANADKQTRDTREIFSIPDAVGILLILNEAAPTLPPDLIRYSLSQVFQKKGEDGSDRYAHNDGVVLISEVHAMAGPGRGMPCFAATCPHTRSAHKVSAFADELIGGWAAFNNLPMVQYRSLDGVR